MADIRIAKAICQIRYPTTPVLFDLRGSIVSEWQFTGDLTEWAIGNEFVLLHNKTKSANLRASVRDASVVVEMPETYAQFSRQASNFLSKTVDMLKIRKLSRVGVRLLLISERPNFPGLLRKMHRSLFQIDEKGWSTLGGVPEDIGISLIHKLNENRLHMKFGPMELEQLKEQFDSDEIKAHLPETVLFVDADLYIQEPNWSSQSLSKSLRNFLDNETKEAQQKVADFIDYYGGFQ